MTYINNCKLMIQFTLMFALLCAVVLAVIIGLVGIVVGKYILAPLILVICILPAFGLIMDTLDRWMGID